MVAREHVDDNAGPLAGANTGEGFRARRVVDPNQAAEDEVSLKDVAAGWVVVDEFGLGDDAVIDLVGEGENTETLTGERLHVEVDVLADFGGEKLDIVADGNGFARWKYSFYGALKS